MRGLNTRNLLLIVRHHIPLSHLHFQLPLRTNQALLHLLDVKQHMTRIVQSVRYLEQLSNLFSLRIKVILNQTIPQLLLVVLGNVFVCIELDLLWH